MSKGTLWSLHIGLTALGLVIVGFLFNSLENPIPGAVASMLLGIFCMAFAAYIVASKPAQETIQVGKTVKRTRKSTSWIPVKGRSGSAPLVQFANPDDYTSRGKKKINPFS